MTGAPEGRLSDGRPLFLNLLFSLRSPIFANVMSKVRALYHIVFCTKRREKTIPLNVKEDLYRFIWRKIEDSRCHLLRIGGVQDHVHILIDLHPTVSLSGLMQTIKGSSSNWMRTDPRFRAFDGWASDYYACTISPDARMGVIEYIKNQEHHHLGGAISDELVHLYKYADLNFDSRDLI